MLTDHDEQMALARQLQAERTPISAPKPRNRGRGRARETSHSETNFYGTHNSTATRVGMTPFATQSSAAPGSQQPSRRGLSTPTTTRENPTVAPTARIGGGGLSTSRWASLPYPEHVASQKSVPAAVQTTSRHSLVYNDSMEVDQPTATPPLAAAQATLPPTNPASVDSGSAAVGSVSNSCGAEPSLLDEGVPMMESMEQPLRPTRMQTMFPFHPGLQASRWRPRTT